MTSALAKKEKIDSHFNDAAHDFDETVKKHQAYVSTVWQNAKPEQIYGWYDEGAIRPIVLSEEPITENGERSYYSEGGMRIMLSDDGLQTPTGPNHRMLFLQPAFLEKQENGYPLEDVNGDLAIGQKHEAIFDLIESIETRLEEEAKIVPLVQS